jgi:uncharacterized protein YndB with AHSA1/START domain
MTSTTKPVKITADPGLPFLQIEREFDAPAAAVFRAHTDLAIYAKWIGPEGAGIEATHLEPAPGGRWRYLVPQEGMPPLEFHGVFHTVEPDMLIIQTFEFNMAPNQVGISTTTFDEADGCTRLTVREVYPSVEARDQALASGMDEGLSDGYARLDAVLAG